MKLAISCNITMTEFWNMTLAEINIVAEVHSKKLEDESKAQIYQAFLISRWVWQKKINIDEILGNKKHKKVMTDQELLNQVEILNIIFGGEVNLNE